jgi:hypothetical protein
MRQIMGPLIRMPTTSRPPPRAVTSPLRLPCSSITPPTCRHDLCHPRMSSSGTGISAAAIQDCRPSHESIPRRRLMIDLAAAIQERQRRLASSPRPHLDTPIARRGCTDVGTRHSPRGWRSSRSRLDRSVRARRILCCLAPPRRRRQRSRRGPKTQRAMHTPSAAPSPPLSWSSPQMAARYISGSMPAPAADDSSARGVHGTACPLLHPTTRHWDLQSGAALYLNPVGSVVTHLFLSSPAGGCDHQALAHLVRAGAPSTSPQPNSGLVVYLS